VRLYIELISSISRRLPRTWTTHIQSSVSGYALPWSQKEFPPRTVEVGTATKIRLTPHLGEFDETALFSRRMDYEREVFVWLEQHATGSYDIVMEIGANVGIYTCFIDALIKATPEARLKEVVAFEPSQEAYRRLLNNLTANEARVVQPFNAAVGKEAGFRSFFEPKNHLTNGSFLKEFSQIFSGDVSETSVLAIGPADLHRFLKGRQRPLIKMDVEGYEATLLSDMAEIIDIYCPDFLIEVLEGSPEELEAIEALKLYRRYLIVEDGLQLHPRLFAAEGHRDWLLVHPSSQVPTPSA
jgi:FkbM family methyltransferase